MIQYSIELLYHFMCEECNKWWSIGDWVDLKAPMACPNCYVKQEVYKNVNSPY